MSNLLRASDLEFRQRFWFIGGVFWIAFALYAVDHQNVTDPLANWLARWDRQGHDANVFVVLGTASAFAVAAAALRVWATSYLRAEVMADHNLRTERLVADGPYRFVRNPLYLGNILLCVGVAPMASRLGAPLLIILMTGLLLRLIVREEAEMRAAQGESYSRFCAAAPRLIPALTPRLPASGARPQWLQALRGEGYIISFALSVVSFTVALAFVSVGTSLKIFYSLLILGFLLAIVIRPSAKPADTAKSQGA